MAHPDYLLKTLTARQLADWEAYDSIEPIGQYRNDIMLGTLCSLIHDCFTSAFSKRGGNKSKHPWSWSYWMEKDHKDAIEHQNKKKGGVSIVKEAFGIHD